MPDLIISPADYPTPKGVESDINSMGTGTAASIEGNTVRLTYSPGEVGASLDQPLSNIPAPKK